MTHLLAISIGPVQDFIAAARRTNDLYAGSDLLQKLAQACAQAVEDAGGQPIFPAESAFASANKVLAHVSDPAMLAESAKSNATKVLQNEWAGALRACAGSRSEINEEMAIQQVNTFLEFFAAWFPWGGDESTYKNARDRVEELLAGRKALREFKQPQKHNKPKSSLDPSRDSVIREPKLCKAHPLLLKDDEHLDAISIIKRVRSVRQNVQSTADLAAQQFLDENPGVRQLLKEKGVPPGAVFKSLRDDLVEELQAFTGGLRCNR